MNDFLSKIMRLIGNDCGDPSKIRAGLKSRIDELVQKGAIKHHNQFNFFKTSVLTDNKNPDRLWLCVEIADHVLLISNNDRLNTKPPFYGWTM